jgi:Putative auto-transporter adhesin, head GIN domain
MKRLFVFAICSATLLSSCHFLHREHIDGNGNVTTQTRNVSNFKGVELSSAINLYIKQDAAYSVKVEIDDNLQPYIMVSEANGILYIKQENNTSLNATGKIKVYVSAPEFKYLEASGACRIIGENTLTSADAVDIHLSGASDAKLELKAPKISADLTGASDITLQGETKDFSIDGSGASHARCFELLSENTDVDLSGASSAEVIASVTINAKASGASNLRYKGNASISQDVSGAGSVKKVD